VDEYRYMKGSWNIEQLKNAEEKNLRRVSFLIEQSKDFIERGDNIVWKLCKMLYRTIQDSHDWFKTLSKV